MDTACMPVNSINNRWFSDTAYWPEAKDKFEKFT